MRPGPLRRRYPLCEAAIRPVRPLRWSAATRLKCAKQWFGRPERILLDNMTPAQLAEVLPLIPTGIEAEISGGVDLSTIRNLALSSSVRPPDFISVGRITHSAPVADFSMRMEAQLRPRRKERT